MRNEKTVEEADLFACLLRVCTQGGLDGRFLISHLKPTNFRVRSLTTISTPHRGSSFADYLLEDIVGVERVPALMGAMKALGVPGGGKAFDDLTT